MTLITQGQMWCCHWTHHIWFPIHINSKHMSIFHHLALIATWNVFSYLLSSGPNYEKSNVHRMTSPWPWMLQGQMYPMYVELLATSPKFYSVLLQGRSFSQIIALFDFSIGYNGQFDIVEQKFVRNWKLKFLCEDHWEQNSGQVWKLLAAICWRCSVLKFSLPLGPILTKTKKKG